MPETARRHLSVTTVSLAVMATRERERRDARDGPTGRAGPTAEDRATDGRTADAAGSASAGDRALGADVRVISRETVVDGTVRHEIGFERRPGS